MRTKDELRYLQTQPLDMKVTLTKDRLRQWIREYGEDGVYLSLSGGKDSTVLSHIIDNFFPDNHIPRVHVRTGLEYPEIEKFCEKFHDLVILKPNMTFKQVIEKYGYPFISKEVGEAVWGAKKYIRAKIAESLQASKQAKIPYRYRLVKLGITENELSETMENIPNNAIADRQTDRQRYVTEAVLSRLSMQNPTPGGLDSKYRKICGIGEYHRALENGDADGEYP